MSLLFAIGAILLILGVIGFFTHIVALGVGAIVIGLVILLVAYFVGGGRHTTTRL